MLQNEEHAISHVTKQQADYFQEYISTIEKHKSKMQNKFGLTKPSRTK